MYGKIVIGLAFLAVGGTILGGCKKEPAEKPAAPEQVTAPTTAPAAKAKTGEALFNQHCTVCHSDGGNTINPEKTLHRKNREANGIKTAEDIIRNMRNPGPGMIVFDEKTISDTDAKAIAEYVLKTF
ncbi:MAG: c-type cytochrome [Deltaproteobacteria bacterium]|nr:c-type cytochrome [Deltaproteobacteria bacterium]